MAARLWHKAPFIRLLAALITGIVLQWHLQWPLLFLVIGFGACFLFVAAYSFTPIHLRFSLAIVNGISVLFLFVFIGAILIWLNDVRNNKAWLGRHFNEGDYIVATIGEPLVEKANSYKAIAHFSAIIKNDTLQNTDGDLILYFKKDSLPPQLHYGNQILFNKNLQAIKNSGNPGGFDYKRYSLFQGITHQAYLTEKDYTLLSTESKSWLRQFIFNTRSWVVGILKKYLPGERESGLAEALLIGYKDDLDKNLVQSYSNTGVVHIIAISGLHLGLIYWLLLLITKPLSRHKKLVWLRLLLTILSLWAFTLLAGAHPSVLRSAVMFTIIAIGQLVARRSSIYNTMALSAFVLLCINPFWLWDVGFQLSYTAVLSIIIFFRPVYNWFYFPNKLINFFWGLTAVTISAQILTLPISIYHFHQMPLLFLLSNFIAVPLSSAIVIGEILLCAFFFFPFVATIIGAVLSHLIFWMNSYIEGLDGVPFSVWNGLNISVLQMVLLLVFVSGFCYWLMERERKSGWIVGAALCLFMLLRAASFTQASRQQKLIVYNVPKYTAIDVIDGRDYHFIGDSALLFDDFVRNFHLQPSRIIHRISMVAHNNPWIKSFRVGTKQVVIIDENSLYKEASSKPSIDLLVLSKNPKLYIAVLTKAFTIKQLVLDGSVPQWKAAVWKKDCDSLNIPCYNVSEQGAFVMNWQ
ncbi:MAG: competence protein ComEC family protein [Bacteroidota bacterium]|nr:competence protein ComEC family protein [Bacteroidota bacterium]